MLELQITISYQQIIDNMTFVVSHTDNANQKSRYNERPIQNMIVSNLKKVFDITGMTTRAVKITLKNLRLFSEHLKPPKL